MRNLANLNKMSDSLTEYAFELYLKQQNDMVFYLLLLGKMNYKVETFPGAGHNYSVVLKSIYDYSQSHPDVNVSKILSDSLSLCSKHLGTPEEFELIMNYIFLQLENEKNNSAPFTMDVLDILNVLRERIASYDKLKSNNLFIEQVQQSDQYLEKNYNHKIL